MRWLCIALTLLCLCTGCGASPAPAKPAAPSQPKAQQQPETLEYQLAVIHNGGWVRHDAPTVAQFKFYLDHLERKTIQDREMVSDMCVKTWQILREEVNPTEDLLEVMKELNVAIPRDSSKLDLAGVAAAYIVLRKAE